MPVRALAGVSPLGALHPRRAAADCAAFDFALFGSPRFVAIALSPSQARSDLALLVHLPQMARGPMALSPAATGFLLTPLTVPIPAAIRWGEAGREAPGALVLRWWLGIVGGADPCSRSRPATSARPGHLGRIARC